MRECSHGLQWREVLSTGIASVAHRCLRRRSGGVGRATTMASRTAAIWLTSCRFAPVTMSDNGTPRPSTRRWRLPWFFPRSVGFAPTASCASGAFIIALSILSPSPGDAFQVVILRQLGLPQRLNTRFSAIRESVCGWRWHYRNALWATPSIGSPCAVHRRCLRTPSALPTCAHPRLAYKFLLRWPRCSLRNQRFNSFPKRIRKLPMRPAVPSPFAPPSRAPARTEKQCTLLFTDKLLE